MRAFAGQRNVGVIGWVGASTRATRDDGEHPANSLGPGVLDVRGGSNCRPDRQRPSCEQCRPYCYSSPSPHLAKALRPTSRPESKHPIESNHQLQSSGALSDLSSGVGSRVAVVFGDEANRNPLGSKPGGPAINGWRAGKGVRASKRPRRWSVEAVDGK